MAKDQTGNFAAHAFYIKSRSYKFINTYEYIFNDIMPNTEDTVIALHITFRSHRLIEHFQFDLSSVQYLSLLFLNFTPLQQDSNCQQHLNDTVSILFLITAEGFNKFSMMQLPDDPNI